MSLLLLSLAFIALFFFTPKRTAELSNSADSPYRRQEEQRVYLRLQTLYEVLERRRDEVLGLTKRVEYAIRMELPVEESEAERVAWAYWSKRERDLMFANGNAERLSRMLVQVDLLLEQMSALTRSKNVMDPVQLVDELRLMARARDNLLNRGQRPDDMLVVLSERVAWLGRRISGFEHHLSSWERVVRGSYEHASG